jgi:tetratricopeptide (TPR) repeat protein
MHWGPPLPDQIAPPQVMRPLLDRALTADPNNPALHAKLGYLLLDGKDFAAAAVSFEKAIRGAFASAPALQALARCYNHLGRYHETLAVLASEEGESVHRGRALMAVGQVDASETEFRAVLSSDVNNASALRFLARILRRSGRESEIPSLCQDLAAQGAANAQLYYVWGWGLAAIGDDVRARRLLFDPERVVQLDLFPSGSSIVSETLNEALADEILTNPNRISAFPIEDEANRGSQRVDDLLSGAQPRIVSLLLEAIQQTIDATDFPQRPGFDPWASARPLFARLRPWGLIQRNADFEEAHIHPSGWLSGVYYVRVPRAIRDGSGRGAIQFEPPSALISATSNFGLAKLYVPREGMLLLAPSHFQHRTIPSLVDEFRISIAFDVVRQVDEQDDLS